MAKTSIQGNLTAFSNTLMLVTVLALPAYAQSGRAVNQTTSGSNSQTASDAPSSLPKGTNELGLWAGGSLDSPTVIGTAQGRKYFTVGLRYGRVLAASKSVAFEYTIDFVPVAVVFQPGSARAFSRSGASSVYGAGLSPIGFKVTFNRSGRFKPFLSASGGFLYFKNAVPDDVPQATRFNYTFDFGGGVQLSTGARRAVVLGYRFQHISNGGRSQINPGLDANVIYAGYSFFR
jgi:Lipid A 3-O-deacylase (PagL)